MNKFIKNISIAEKFAIIVVVFSLAMSFALLFAVGFFPQITLVLATLFFGIGIFIAYQVSHYLHTEIEYLRIGASKIATGDFTTMGSIYAVNSADEVGQLASSFTLMADKLKDSYATLEKKVEARTKDLQKANADIEENNKSLKEALEAKSEFLRLANHQLNTPLSIMNNAYSMIEDKSITLKKGVEYWGGALKRMNQVVEDFWTAFELDGQFKAAIVKSDVSAVVREAVEDKKKMLLATGKELQIIIEEPSFPIPQVLCDVKKINDVMYNLLQNAILYTPDGVITVSYELMVDNTYLKINIKDTGIGFSKEDGEKIAQKFYRTRPALLTHPDGSGLGLFICRMIIEINGGKLRCESDGEGKGSTFSFTLPIAK